MKTAIIFLFAATLAFAADKRIKDITTTATSPASDDYVAIDGTTNGTRKILPGGAVIRPDAAMGALEVSTSNRITNTKTLAATTATLTFSAAPTAGTTFYLRLTGHTSDCTVTIPSSYSVARSAAITTFIAKANAVYEISWSYDGSTYYIVGEPDLLTITPPAAATTLTVASGSSLTTAGAYTSTLTMTANTTVTLPTTGTLGTTAQDLAGLVGTYASPDTTGGAVTLTNAVTEVWTNTTTTYSLPAVASNAGKAVIFYVTGTNALTIDVNASEIIVRDGTAQTGGVTLTLTGTAGNYVALVCDGTRWVTLGFKGTLAAGS